MFNYLVWCPETAPALAPSSWFCTVAATAPAAAPAPFSDFSTAPGPCYVFLTAPAPALAPKTAPRGTAPPPLKPHLHLRVWILAISSNPRHYDSFK